MNRNRHSALERLLVAFVIVFAVVMLADGVDQVTRAWTSGVLQAIAGAR
jgi:hypothetical protein